MIFALPWYGRTLVGTTDNDYDGDIDHPRPGERRRRLPARRGQRVLRHRARAESDLVGAYAGVRPLISTGDPRKSVDISRKAELYETSSGMLTITGGKLTTWRRMAKQTVDRLVEREGREAPCHTAEIPLGMEARPEDLEAPDGRGGGGGRPARLPLRPRRRASARASPREDPKLARADRRRPPRPAGRGRDRRPPRAGPLASPTCCCAAPASACSPRRSCATPASVRPVAEALGAELGWSRRQVKRRRRPGRRRRPRRASTPPAPTVTPG